MLRLLWYLLVGYVLWKIVQVVMKVLTGPLHPGQSHPAPPGGPSPQKKEFTDVRDAEFEDITPKNDTKKQGS